MSIHQPRALTITLEAKSDEHLKKLLELALFDLDKVQQAAWNLAEGDSVPASMAGDMGSYHLEYKLGTHELVAAHGKLLEQGYRKVESTEWETENYSWFDHPDKAPMRVYQDSAETVEHDAEEHMRRKMRF